MVDILALVLQHDEEAVPTAVELALAEGVATKTHVLSLLHRLIDGKMTGPELHTPAALILLHESRANVERYDDGLRSQPAEAVMRHDPASGAIVIMLRSLKLHGMAQAVTKGAPAFEVAVPILSQLLKAELAEREVRSIVYPAHFPGKSTGRDQILLAQNFCNNTSAI